jgi:hypothetical protein
VGENEKRVDGWGRDVKKKGKKGTIQGKRELK